MNRPSLSELRAMPTLAVGQTDDLKVDTGTTRLWLSRMNTEDGAPYDNAVTVERLVGGRWVISSSYEAL